MTPPRLTLMDGVRFWLGRIVAVAVIVLAIAALFAAALVLLPPETPR